MRRTDKKAWGTKLLDIIHMFNVNYDSSFVLKIFITFAILQTKFLFMVTSSCRKNITIDRLTDI